MKKTILLIAAFICCILCSYYLGQRKGIRLTDEWYKNHTDTSTTVQIDSNRLEKPVADTVYVDSLVYYPVYIDSEIPEPQIIYRDSVHYVLMEKVVKEYKTDNYFAKISGVDPNLDFIETYNKTVTNTVYIPQKIDTKKNYAELDMKFGYYGELTSPLTLNIGHEYNLFDFYAGGGYDFIQRTPVFQVGIRTRVRF